MFRTNVDDLAGRIPRNGKQLPEEARSVRWSRRGEYKSCRSSSTNGPDLYVLS
jgi:hypothetical protein